MAKRYKFEVVITEGYDHFWDSIQGKTGCDEVLEAMKDELYTWDPEITLVEYTDTK